MIDYITAIDSIFEAFKAVWDEDTTAVVGYVPAVYWQGIEEPEKPDASKYWVRLSQQSVNETQKTFVGENSKKRFQNDGLVFVQLFCPKVDSQSFQIGRELAVVARDAFRGKVTSSGVWFRNARIKELSDEEGYHRFNVVADYQFDEMEN
jgi:hypothetical protein